VKVNRVKLNVSGFRRCASSITIHRWDFPSGTTAAVRKPTRSARSG
jgi:hypothetical protein